MIYEGRVDCNVLFRSDPAGVTARSTSHGDKDSAAFRLEQPDSVSYHMGIVITQEGARDGRLEINVGTHGEVAWD